MASLAQAAIGLLIGTVAEHLRNCTHKDKRSSQTFHSGFRKQARNNIHVTIYSLFRAWANIATFMELHLGVTGTSFSLRGSPI